MIKIYYSLAKPGIVYGNALTAAAGFLLASEGSINLLLFVVTLIGLSCIVASACVFNNYIDSDIDERMERTKDRALVEGSVPERAALLYATILGLLGAGILFFYTNGIALGAAALGFFIYVVLYSLWAKRRSMYATHIGSLAGAMPPVVGYTALTHSIDGGAVILFFILCFWQMPHFFSIALYRLDEYRQASIPVWPLQQGALSTKRQMLLYLLLYLLAVSSLTFFGYGSVVYLAVTLLIGVLWLLLCLQGFWADDTKQWARRMFIFSLVVIVFLCFMMAIH